MYIYVLLYLENLLLQSLIILSLNDANVLKDEMRKNHDLT